MHLLYTWFCIVHSGLFKPKVGSDMDKPNYWVKILNIRLNPTVGFVHI